MSIMSLSQSLLKSSFILFASKLLTRGIGLVSTLILARLLTPEDYGIVAIATVLVFLFDEISNSGMKEYVIHKSEVDDSVLNTAWTLNLITKTVVWLLFLILIPFITDFYSNPELTNVLFVISLILPLGALQNVGIVMYEKELNYKPIFYLELSQKLIAFFFIIGLALWLGNYWAMIIGTVISYVILVVGSYIVHEYRPKIYFERLKEQWNFSKWMIPRGFLGFSRAEFDTFLVSKLFDIGSLGGFSVMKNLTAMVGRDVILPATQPLLASFSKAQDDQNRLNYQLTLSLLVTLIISLPIMSFTWIFHYEIVRILLGEKWVEYSGILQALSILIGVYAMGGILGYLLTSLGRVKHLFYFELFGLIFTVITLLTISFDDIVEFSFLRSIVAFILVAVTFVYVKYVFKFSVGYFMFLTLPVFFATFIAGAFVQWIDLGDSMALIASTFIYGVLFSCLYLISLLVLLCFYRDKSEIVYLRWVVGQTKDNILKKIRRE